MLEFLDSRTTSGLALAAGLGLAFLAGSVGAAPRGASEAERAGAPPRPVIIDGRTWTCGDGLCRAAAALDTADSQPVTRECARAAAVLGPFQSYGTGDRILSAAELARCNARAPAAPAALVAGR